MWYSGPMPKQQHRLSEIDPVERMALCRKCGRTSVRDRTRTKTDGSPYVVWECILGVWDSKKRPHPVHGPELPPEMRGIRRAPEGQKWCSTCTTFYSLDAFYNNSAKPDGKSSECRECDDKRSEKRRQTRRHKGKWSKYLKKYLYGLTDQELHDLITKANGVCTICKNPPLPNDTLNVDHCHATGRVRALLCRGCNTGLGFFKDKPELLREAANYLESFS